MCVLYVRFGSKLRPKTFGCVAMRSAVLFIFRSRLLLYSAGTGVNRVHVVLSGFSVRMLCFVQEKSVCRYGCMYFFAALVLDSGEERPKVSSQICTYDILHSFSFIEPENSSFSNNIKG